MKHFIPLFLCLTACGEAVQQSASPYNCYAAVYEKDLTLERYLVGDVADYLDHERPDAEYIISNQKMYLNLECGMDKTKLLEKFVKNHTKYKKSNVVFYYINEEDYFNYKRDRFFVN